MMKTVETNTRNQKSTFNLKGSLKISVTPAKELEVSDMDLSVVFEEDYKSEMNREDPEYRTFRSRRNQEEEGEEEGEE